MTPRMLKNVAVRKLIWSSMKPRCKIKWRNWKKKEKPANVFRKRRNLVLTCKPKSKGLNCANFPRLRRSTFLSFSNASTRLKGRSSLRILATRRSQTLTSRLFASYEITNTLKRFLLLFNQSIWLSDKKLSWPIRLR